MKDQPKSNLLIARIREEADAKESAGKPQVARRARFAASSIEKCFGEGRDFVLTEINKAWLDQYLHYLQSEHKTDNTISSYFRTILSAFRSAVKSGEPLDLTLFDSYFTGNAKSTQQILSAEDVKCVISSDLKDAVFKRTRDVFCLCFLGGGLRIADLQSMSQATQDRLHATDEAKSILRRYAQGDLLSFLGENPQQAYNHNLAGLAYKLKIKAKLDEDSAAEGWAEMAKSIGISHDTISNVVGRHIENLHYAQDAVASHEEVSKALVGVAKSIGVNAPHWYAIRCYEDTPEDVAEKITSLPSLKSLEVKHFFLADEARKTGVQNTTTQKNYMKSILFLRCLDADIYSIRRTLAPSIYVFDYRCSTEKRPAIISDAEMKTFMYLAGLGADSMTYYFPDEVAKIPAYEEYEDVTITEGLFAGVDAKVYRKSKDKLNVIVRFEQANIWYTVDIPYCMLKPKTGKE